jgi:sporulation protein YhbH
VSTIFRDYSSSDALQSDRSSGDRLRHRQKVREAIRDNIADIISEQAIVGRSRDTIVKVPLRGIKEYRFVFGNNNARAGQGQGDSQPGQRVGKVPQPGDEAGEGEAGDQPGVDFYETDITLEELIDLMFEDLELPDLERKALRETISHSATKRKGYRKVGIRVQLDKRRTALARVKRKFALNRDGDAPDAAQREDDASETRETDMTAETIERQAAALPGVVPVRRRFPFLQGDMRFRRRSEDSDYDSNAVVICMMDTSGSMDRQKKYLARSFFFLLYQFVRTRYQQVELVFIAHDAEAKEVSEEDFFHKGESGGTLISSAYARALEVIDQRYHPALWNIYAFHCSDGDNMPGDSPRAVKLANELCQVCNLFGYGEIKPSGYFRDQDAMLGVFKAVKADNFQAIRIGDKSDVWGSFRKFLIHDRAGLVTAE